MGVFERYDEAITQIQSIFLVTKEICQLYSKHVTNQPKVNKEDICKFVNLLLDIEQGTLSVDELEFVPTRIAPFRVPVV